MKRVVTTFNQKKALVGRGRLVKNFMLIKNYYEPSVDLRFKLYWPNWPRQTRVVMTKYWNGSSARVQPQSVASTHHLDLQHHFISFFSILILYVHWKSSFPQYLYPQMYLNLQPEGYLYNVLVGVWYPLSGIVSISNNNVDWLMSNCQGGAEPRGPHGASH